MPNLDPWIDKQVGNNNNNNQNTEQPKETKQNFENYLLSYRAQCQNTIDRNSGAHPTYLETYQKRIEILDWTIERYRFIQQQEEEQAHQNNQNQNDLLIIINRINEELYEKKKIARNNLEKSELRDEQ